MKKSIATILLPIQLIAALLGSNAPSELSKIGNLIDHYEHHVREHGQHDLTILDFLIEHFGLDHGADDEHEALPLLGGCGAPAAAAEVEQLRIDLQLSTVNVSGSPLRRTEVVPQTPASEIFQPPRLI